MNPLIRAIPGGLVRVFARPYVAGSSLTQAIDAAADLWTERKVMTSLDLLAEGIESREAVQENIQTYLQMIDAVAEDTRFPTHESRPTLSLKQSSYTTRPLERGGDGEGAREAVLRISEHAKHKGVRLTVDMESSEWTDFTLETLHALHAAGHHHVGAVLQTRLHRTRADLDKLPPKLRVRLVIGIYQEPPAVAIVDKRQMKERLLEYAGILLQRGHYVELGTHDEHFVRRFVDEVAPRLGVGQDRFELQMLYGVPRDRLVTELVQRGIRCRMYVPFALGWAEATAYLRRRLDEYPAMMFLVAKNMWSRG